MRKILFILIAFHLSLLSVSSQILRERYTKDRPVVVVCDWDRPPYEFLDDHGLPAGSNVDVLIHIMDEIEIPVVFVMKEWSNAVKTFERGDADLIMANIRRFKNEKGLYATQIINYDRPKVAMTSDTLQPISVKTLEQEGVALKTSDYTTLFFDIDSTNQNRIEFQSPKVALTGLLHGDNKYFVWGEEPLKWKLKELNLEGIYLNDVAIPVGEVHIMGRDKDLIYRIDDLYSRLKQSGELEEILNKWYHPERVKDRTTPMAINLIIGALLIVAFIILFSRLAHRHVNKAHREASKLNDMMIRALGMGNFIVMEYDIANNRFTNHHGDLLPKEGITLEEFALRISPESRSEFRQKMQQLMDGRTRKFDLNKRWNAGTEEEPHWLNLHGHAISELDGYGRPAYIINALHDVTHDVEEDLATRELMHKYNALINNPVLPIALYNNEGWLVYINDAMKRLCGFTPHDPSVERFWLNHNMFDTPLFRNTLSNDNRDPLMVCRHMSYPDIDVDRYIEMQIIPLFDKEGNTVSFLDSSIDMTEHHVLDVTLHQQQREIRQTKADSARLKSKLDFMLENSERHLEPVGEGKYQVVKDDRRMREARLRLEQETQRAEDSVKQKSGFMASMTHELRTPLNAIVGFTGVLDALGDSPERGEYVRIIRNSSDMLQRLINDIIESSSVNEGGQLRIVPEDVDFAEAFDEICLTLEQRVQQPAVKFQKDNPYEHFPARLDLERIQQVLTNFVTNAVKFTKEGHIRVGYRQEEGGTRKEEGLYIYCEDTGIGIAKEKQAQVFERFVKLDEFTQGTGMGLTISKNIAESMNGEIGLESEGAGHGTTFWLWIPL